MWLKNSYINLFQGVVRRAFCWTKAKIALALPLERKTTKDFTRMSEREVFFID